MTDDKFIYSGNFTNNQFGGDNSTFIQNNAPGTGGDPDVERLRSLIDELTLLISRYADRIDRPEHARRDADDIIREIEQPAEDRDTGRISDAFRRLRTKLQPVAELSESMGKIADFLAKIIPS